MSADSDQSGRNPPQIIKGLAQRLIALRREYGLSQEKLANADAIGVSRSYISQIEAEGRVPARALLLRIAAFFEVSVDWLITGEGERTAGAAEANEALLIEFYRNAEPEDKEALLAVAKRLAAPPPQRWDQSTHAPINIRKRGAKKSPKDLPRKSGADID